MELFEAIWVLSGWTAAPRRPVFHSSADPLRPPNLTRSGADSWELGSGAVRVCGDTAGLEVTEMHGMDDCDIIAH